MIVKRSWIQLRNLNNARTLLILPCNAAAWIGNYFRAETYSKNGWNTWREADMLLRKLREKGKVAFAAMDSSTLETEPRGSKGAIVFETEMDRARSPSAKDWGAPNWHWFKPTKSGKCEYLEAEIILFDEAVFCAKKAQKPPEELKGLNLAQKLADLIKLGVKVLVCGSCCEVKGLKKEG